MHTTTLFLFQMNCHSLGAVHQCLIKHTDIQAAVLIALEDNIVAALNHDK